MMGHRSIMIEWLSLFFALLSFRDEWRSLVVVAGWPFLAVELRSVVIGQPCLAVECCSLLVGRPFIMIRTRSFENKCYNCNIRFLATDPSPPSNVIPVFVLSF